MKKHFKYICLLLAMLFIISGTVMAASAAPDGGDDPEYVDPNTGEDPNTGDDPGSGEDPGYVDPGSGEDPGYVDPGSGEDPNTGDDPGSGEDPGYVDPGTGDNNNYVDDDPLWYGDASDYDYNSGDTSGNAGSVADSTKLYDTSDSNSLDVSPNQWSNISLDTKEAADSTKSGGSFSSIKTSGVSATDESGKWLVWLGIALIVLSVLGILYFIVATMNASKQKQRENAHSTAGGGDRPARAAAEHSSAPRAKTERDAAPRAMAERDAAPRAKAERDEAPRATDSRASIRRSAPSRHASKADTAEVYIPRRSK